MSLQWTGLDQLYEALRQLPREMASQAADVVEHATTSTGSRLRAAYPEGESGNLRRGVKTQFERSASGAFGQVRSTARHAHLWEYGTQNRRTLQGWNRGRGPSHAREGLSAIASRARRQMNQQLVEIVRRAGFDVEVSGL